MTIAELLREIDALIEAERPNRNVEMTAADGGLFHMIISEAFRKGQYKMGRGHRAFRPPRDDAENQ